MNDRLDLQFGRGRGGIFRAGPRPRRPLQAIVMKPWPGAKIVETPRSGSGDMGSNPAGAETLCCPLQ